MKRLYMVMKAIPWEAITHHGVPLVPPKDGPSYFVPVFKTYEAAEAWLGDRDEEIMELAVPEATLHHHRV